MLRNFAERLFYYEVRAYLKISLRKQLSKQALKFYNATFRPGPMVELM